MTDSRKGLTLNKLTFTGSSAVPVELNLSPGLNVLYGASNTGKSFTVKAIDFMLGSSRELPDIDERRPYERAWLAIHLPKSGNATLMRALAGGSFEFRAGHAAIPPSNGENVRQLSARHDHSSTDNLSQFLLEELGFVSRYIAVDANGKKRSLSFRDLSRFCITDETAIQSEASPAESGQYQFTTAERGVFKLLVTGNDDSAIVPVLDRKTFKAATAGKLEVLDEMIAAIGDELAADFPHAEQLPDQSSRLETAWTRAQREFQLAHDSIRSRLTKKRQLADSISLLEKRRAEIQINLGRFEQLEEVYRSDIERLDAIEEAGFLLALGGDKECPLCGAPPTAHRLVHGIDEIEKARDAASAEVNKIKRQSVDLRMTIGQLDIEGRQIELRLVEQDGELTEIETQLTELAPAADVAKRRLEESQSVRDHVREGLALVEQKGSLQTRRDELAALKPASKSERPRLGVPSTAVHDFAQTISNVLSEWQFPGKRHVSFDEGNYDLRIDGKHRKDNGKGVRAITHAAFKVALLLFCRERKLPHPGFLVLDTPLLTYRDPLHSKAGPLSADETVLSNTSLKEFFFEHLSKNVESGQFLVIENVDLPVGIDKLANIETLTGDPASGRAGLFPTPDASASGQT
jgi:hypothetical protein